jgi:hypothetical protein
MPKARLKTRVVAADRETKSPSTAPAYISHIDVARRAYDIYLARGCEHGHDVDDWLQAERDLAQKLAP